MAVAAALAVAFFAVVASPEDRASQGTLALNPASGPAGTHVVASQTVEPTACATFAVRWDGQPVGSDGGADGTGEVGFDVPAGATTGSHTVTATCDGRSVGTARFDVTPPLTTTSTTTRTTVPSPPTSSPATSTPPQTGTTDPPSTDTTDTTEVRPVPQTIADCELEAREAQAELAYEPDRQMVVGRTYEVQAALALGDMPPTVTFEDTTTVVRVPGTRCTVEAQLLGSDFDVAPAEAREQSFVGTRTLVWRWQVRPHRAGTDLELVLRLQATIVEEDQSRPGHDVLFESAIDVDATPVSWWRRLTDGTAAVFGHPVVQYFLLPASGSGALLLWLKRRLKAPARPGDGG